MWDDIEQREQRFRAAIDANEYLHKQLKATNAALAALKELCTRAEFSNDKLHDDLITMEDRALKAEAKFVRCERAEKALSALKNDALTVATFCQNTWFSYPDKRHAAAKESARRIIESTKEP